MLLSSELRIIFDLEQHRVRLGKYKRDADSVQTEGEYIQAVWSPDAKLIATLVSSCKFPLVIFALHLVVDLTY